MSNSNISNFGYSIHLTSPMYYLGIVLVCFLGLVCFILLLYIPVHKSDVLQFPVHNIKQDVTEKYDPRRNNIDVRYAIIPNGVIMRDHDNNQCNTPNRSSTFFYSNNDRSGGNITHIHSSPRASHVSVMIDDRYTTGYCLGGVGSGNLLNTKSLKVNKVWWWQATINSDITSVGMPVYNTLQYCNIRYSSPVVSSVTDDQNRDIRNSVNYITH